MSRRVDPKRPSLTAAQRRVLDAAYDNQLRVLYNTRSGVRPVFGLAADAFHKSQDGPTAKRAPESKPQRPQSLASILARVMP